MENLESNTKFKQMLNKVPEITLYFWIIKILCTTVGETFADFLNTNFNLGLTGIRANYTWVSVAATYCATDRMLPSIPVANISSKNPPGRQRRNSGNSALGS